RTGRILDPQEGLGGRARGGSQRNEEEIKKNPSVEGHREILRVPKKNLPKPNFILLSKRGVVK
ncbi:MAG TPA: hypothetical protein VEL68_03140, partial [Thermodesulfobacteriota bacterium]|nr:hypothetical protein [Thermodesulfobacteriota bacterium]